MRHPDLFRERAGPVRVKVCCIASIEEAELALDAGADALGLVSAMPSGPGVITDADIATIADWVGARAATVLLTSRTSAADIDEQLRRSRPSVLQMCDALPEGELAIVRERHPDVLLMPVIHVRDGDSVNEAVRSAVDADAILLDSGNPLARIKELGGTGRVHDWQVSRTIRDAVSIPLFLAGGLRAANVAEAVRTVRPFGVDVCSGVRRDGKLDRSILTEFMTAVRSAT
ncbi:MAG: phosphoribosylanthranilate isomerase [Gemmatimonadaceae bacterium]